MSKIRNRFGIGPLWAIIAICYSVIAIYINKLFLDNKRIPFLSVSILHTIGVFLIVAGLLLFINSIILFNKAYNSKVLLTKGMYGIIRHPLYASITILIVPGCVLLLNKFMGLTVPIIMYITFRLLIGKEEKRLINNFGEEYLKYKKNVNAMFPKTRFRTLIDK